jgi:hypothetical protein
MQSRWLWADVLITIGGLGFTLWKIQTAHPIINPLTLRMVMILVGMTLIILVLNLIPWRTSGVGRAIRAGLLILAWLGWMFFFNETAWLGPGLVVSTLWATQRDTGTHISRL